MTRTIVDHCWELLHEHPGPTFDETTFDVGPFVAAQLAMGYPPSYPLDGFTPKAEALARKLWQDKLNEQ